MVSSARNPNESYADRAKKASTSSTHKTNQQKNHHQPTANAPSVYPSSSLKPPQVNVWAERIKEQQTHALPQPAQMPRQRATSSPQPNRDDAIQPRSPPPDLSVQLAILDEKDEHDPFVVRVPPHLSRQSSSSTNPLPAGDPAAWPLLPGTAPHSNDSPAGYDSPFVSAPPSRQNSTASIRHHAHSPSGSLCLSGAQIAFSQHSRSSSQSRAQSGSGSSASSPRLQIRGRTLPQDDSLLPDLRLDSQHRKSSNKRSSPVLPDPPNHLSNSFQIDLHADPSAHRRPPVPPLHDMSPRYALIPQYVLPPHFPSNHVPGHTSPYAPSHSGQGTPPYPPYPPFPAYMYGHPPYFWGDISPRPPTHFQNQSCNHAVPHKIEFGSISPVITTEPGASIHPARVRDGSQPRSSKSVVFGTINPAETQSEPATPPDIEQLPDVTVEHAMEQFTAFSIGLGPDEPGPSRHASRKSSVKSLSKTLSSQPNTCNGAKDTGVAPSPAREVNGIKTPIKWEFGTTHSEDLDEPEPPSLPSSLSTSIPPPNHPSEPVDDRLHAPVVRPSHHTSQDDHSIDKSETASTTSDVWVVKDFGYGFGNHSGCGNAPDLVRLEMRERERERARENQREREMIRDQHRDRAWVPTRQPAWRHENGVEEGREGWEQQVHVDAPRHTRPRRGSFPGYGGHDRGGFSPRRGRGFGGRFPGGRGRGGFFHHQRPGSYPHVPPPPPPPPPQPSFEVLHQTSSIDAINGYGPYAQPDLEPYEAVPPPPQPRVPYTPAAYTVDAMRNCLLSQLEYYLSPQNMAQDFYLRQRMDDEGWIPISLLASFKRVKQLQTDASIVKDVLSRSAAVEMNGEWVRMGRSQWELFVLPNAPRSVVPGPDRGGGEIPRAGAYQQGDTYAEHEEIDGENGELEGDCDGEDCEGDDEDDEIEFVIGEEAEGSWMVPERKQ